LLTKLWVQKNSWIINHKGYKTKRVRNFSIATLKEILDNPMYIGKSIQSA